MDLTKDLKFFNLNISSIQKNLIQNQSHLYILNQNIDPAKIVLNSKKITS